MAHAGGRPTKYTPEIVEKARAWVHNWKPTEGIIIPSHVSLALYLGIASKTLYTWGSEEGKEEFSQILGECMDLQQQVLINQGLGKVFDSGITKLVLGKHGFHDKQDNTHSAPGGGPIQTIELVPLKSNKEEDD